jgi:HAD superfamily hydrolase (TIGR01509 family)
MKAVLFDLDGVLVDSYDTWFHLMNAAATEFGNPAISREAFADCWGQGVHEDVRLFYPQKSVAELEEYYDANFMAHIDHLRVDPDAGRVFELLRERGTPTALITNTSAPLAREILALARATPDRVVGGTDVPEPKPAPDMVLLACRDLDVEPQHAWLVGDSDHDRRAARAAGVRFAGFRTEGDIRIEALMQVLDLIP